MNGGPQPLPTAEAARSRPQEVLATLATSRERGLTGDEAARRLARLGPNRLAEEAPPGWPRVMINQLRSPVVALLAVAAVLAAILSEATEAVAIGFVLVLNTAIGMVSELRAIHSMAALRRLGEAQTTVLRDGRKQGVSAHELVPGDIVLLAAGDLVTADLRVLEGEGLEANESTFTGESATVAKRADAVPERGDSLTWPCVLYKGTSVSRGAAVAVVTATGAATELGAIGALATGAESSRTPLERRLAGLARQLIWLTGAVTAAVMLIGVVRGEDVGTMLRTGMALAVAAIPEGLPIVTTLALARGMWRMARSRALVKRLSAVETLGATTVILVDKTGTLTENRMAVRALETTGGEDARREALEVMALCNDAADTERGDPMEAALLAYAAAEGLEIEALRRRWPRVGEAPFDARTRMMETTHDAGGTRRTAIKGAPEAVLLACRGEGPAGATAPLDDAGRARWQRRVEALAASGLRVLGLAADGNDAGGPRFLGIVGLLDPPRSDVAEAVAALRRAGVQVTMVTGDNVHTARHIAHRVGIVDDPDAPARDVLVSGLAAPGEAPEIAVWARVDPAQKFEIVRALQDRGEVVAMTGDGVNDAPALRQADIGVAMGQRGTQVAREAAHMVLTDDRFAAVAIAVRLGRGIFANIRKFVVYLLSCNLSEVLVVAFATLAGMPLPLAPLQILYLNLVTDVFPALALGACAPAQGTMDRPPRDPREPVLTGRHARRILASGLVITAAVLAAFAWALADRGAADAVTVAFMTLAFAQLWHVFVLRNRRRAVLRNEVTANPWVWGAIVLCVALLLVAMYVPVLSDALAVRPLPGRAWAMVLGLSAVPLALDLVASFAPRRRRGQANPHGRARTR